MCGIAAILLAHTQTSSDSTAAARELYEALAILQHRGQDAAGIQTCGHRGRLFQCKGNGMVRDVFSKAHMDALNGWMGCAHVRYPTAGSSSNSEAQPFYVNSPYGISLAHNGNLTNAAQLEEFLDFEAHRHVNTASDSELLLNIFANNLQKTGKFRVNEEDIFLAIQGVYNQCRGGFAAVGMIAGFGLFAFRDPNGIRPLVYGSRTAVGEDATEPIDSLLQAASPNGTTPVSSARRLDYMFSSESVALDVLGYSDFIDVPPGGAVIISRDGKVSCRQITQPAKYLFSPCIFEYVYFARPDSIIDGVSVYRARLAMGEALAKAVVKNLGPDAASEIDVVVPVPDTSRVAALQLATSLNVIYREGFIKNRYIGRTFIMPGQLERKRNVRRKLNPMRMEFNNRNVLIVDDSIVRGTTSQEIVQMARDSGARKVYFASCAPPIRYPNVYGIDMPTSKELVAFNRSEAEIARVIGADHVIFQDLHDLSNSVSQFNKSLQSFDMSVFNGSYVTGDVTQTYLTTLEDARKDSAKSGKKSATMADTDVIGLHNTLYD
ncbi:MAG: hypothetical protein SGCHY_005044 [Lobulomycetales sp.]